MNNEGIKRAALWEKPKIVSFLNENWGDNHRLVNNETFFNYYYLDGENINFYYLEEEGKIAAICGYIKCSQSPHSDIWVSIWCAKKGKNGLGLALMGAMQSLTGANVMACNNIRENTLPFYNFLGYYPGKMQHYYRLNDLEKYNIAVVNNKNILPCTKADGVVLKEFRSIAELQQAFPLDSVCAPHKDYWYLNKRYFNNPYLSYIVLGLYQNNACVSLVVFRVNKGEEGNVLRLVDYVGAPHNFELLNGWVDVLLQQLCCEYCDMYSVGVNGGSAGFSLLCDGDTNILPNYLNPILQENIDYFYFTTHQQDFMMFKADGDQDRKNIF
ncbi:MAG: hypothetical protein RR827_07560 [Oscillospiraceae bacterium]